MDFGLGDSDEDEGDASDAFGENSDTPWVRRRSLRNATVAGSKNRNPLPFSPKKTRSKRVTDYFSVPRDGPSATRSPTPAVRWSSRRKRVVDNDYEDQAQSSDANTASTRLVKSSRNRVLRNTASRPAYGYFRKVADMDYDSDEDTAPLHAHRNECAKCGLKATHLELDDLRRKKPKKKRTRKDDIDFVESEEDNDRIERLGGWVRWLVA